MFARVVGNAVLSALYKQRSVIVHVEASLPHCHLVCVCCYTVLVIYCVSCMLLWCTNNDETDFFQTSVMPLIWQVVTVWCTCKNCSISDYLVLTVKLRAYLYFVACKHCNRSLLYQKKTFIFTPVKLQYAVMSHMKGHRGQLCGKFTVIVQTLMARSELLVALPCISMRFLFHRTYTHRVSDYSEGVGVR